MKRIKRGLFILLFFGLLAGIAAAPTLVTEYYNGRLLNAVTLRELPPEESQGAASVWEKLEVVEQARKDGTYYRDDYIYIARDSERAEERKLVFDVLPMLQEQLDSLLEGMGILIEGMEEISSTKTVYVDRERREIPVGIWHVIADTPEYIVDAFMDAETGMLYEISLYSKYQMFSVQAPEHLREAGRKYMDLDSEKKPNGGGLDVGVDYDDSYFLRLYIYGTNDADRNGFVVYDFNQDWMDASVSVGSSVKGMYEIKDATIATDMMKFGG